MYQLNHVNIGHTKTPDQHYRTQIRCCQYMSEICMESKTLWNTMKLLSWNSLFCVTGMVHVVCMDDEEKEWRWYIPPLNSRAHLTTMLIWLITISPLKYHRPKMSISRCFHQFIHLTFLIKYANSFENYEVNVFMHENSSHMQEVGLLICRDWEELY